MPRKIKDLVNQLKVAGFVELKRRGKGSHRLFFHPEYPGALTISGQMNDDARPYQEKAVTKALEELDA